MATRGTMRSPHETFYARTSGVAARHGRREWVAILVALLLGGALSWAAATGKGLFALAGIVALLYSMLAWRAPGAALAMVFAASVFQSDLSGGGPAKFSPAEAMLALLVPVMVVRCVAERRFPEWGPIFWPVCLYLGVCGISFVRFAYGNALTKDATISMLQMVLYFFVAVGAFATLPRRASDLLLPMRALSFVGVFFALAGLATNYAFLGGNKNGIGASLACALLVTLVLWMDERRRVVRGLLMGAMLVILVGLLGSLSRGAWLGTFAGLLVICALRRKWKIVIGAILITIPIACIGYLLLPPQLRQYVFGFDVNQNYNIKLRYQSVEIARFLWERDRWLGAGVGFRKLYDATNLAWALLAETGVAGLVTFVGIHFAFWFSTWRAATRLFRERLQASRTEPNPSEAANEAAWPTFLAIGAALVTYKFAHGMVDHYWSRGAVTLAWAACGMSAWALAEMRRRDARRRAELQAQDPWANWMNSASAMRRSGAPLAPPDSTRAFNG